MSKGPVIAVCSVEGCGRKKFCRGHCQTHYKRAIRGLIEMGPIEPRRSKGEPGCDIEGCLEPHMGRGLCNKHYLQDTVTPEISRRRSLWAHYKMTPEQYDALLASQGGGCSICGAAESLDGRRLAVDHDHKCCPGTNSCGKCVRGLLCANCNRAIGLLQDDVSNARLAVQYLERWTG